MSDWLENLKREKEVRERKLELENKKKEEERKRQEELFRQSPEFFAIQAHDAAFMKFYDELYAYSLEVSKVTSHYFKERKMYEGNGGFLIKGPEIRITELHQSRADDIYRIRSIYVCKDNSRRVDGFFRKKWVGGRLTKEFLFRFEIYEGSPRMSGSDGDYSWDTDYSLKSKFEKLYPLSQINKEFYGQICRWLIEGKGF